MPATQIPASDRQVNFINSLRAERGMNALLPTEAARLTGGRTGSASRMITELMATPRTQDRAAGAAPATPTPSTNTRAGRMLRAGGIEATVTLLDGRHVTLQISTRVPSGRGWRNGEPGEPGARTNIKVQGQRIGWVNVEAGQWRVTLRTRREEYRAAVEALFNYAAAQTAHGLLVQEASRCGRCRRTLTDPVSIQRGIGPECYGRSTGSQHVNAANSGRTVNRGSDTDVCGCAYGNTEGITERECIASGMHGSIEQDQRDYERTEAQNNAAFARREREQEERAFASDPDYRRSLTEMAATFGEAEQAVRAAVPAVQAANVRSARDLIEAALKAYVEDELVTDAAAADALSTFDRLARV